MGRSTQRFPPKTNGFLPDLQSPANVAVQSVAATAQFTGKSRIDDGRRQAERLQSNAAGAFTKLTGISGGMSAHQTNRDP
jgi:hypothetical protein